MTLALWTLKCASLIVFQNKIIYMPGLPPYTRREKLEDYRSQCGEVLWSWTNISSADGQTLAVAIGQDKSSMKDGEIPSPPLVILYFQGNGSSTPPRLPMLSRVLASTERQCGQSITLCALSYRGYWSSTGSPSQSGLELDARAFLEWALRTYPSSAVIIWGQSIGAGVATTMLAAHLGSDPAPSRISGVILETPFVSIRRMLAGLYPQKWLPYRYLWPFLQSHWDSKQALNRIKHSAMEVPPILLLTAADDEVVPTAEAAHLEELCRALHFRVQRVDVSGALHHQASEKPSGRTAIAKFVTSVVRQY